MYRRAGPIPRLAAPITVESDAGSSNHYGPGLIELARVRPSLQLPLGRFASAWPLTNADETSTTARSLV